MNTSMRRVIVAMSIMVSVQGTVLLSFDDFFKKAAFYTGITATVGGVSYWAYKNISVRRAANRLREDFADISKGKNSNGSTFNKLYLKMPDEIGMPKQTAPVQSVTVNVADNNGHVNNGETYNSWLDGEIGRFGGTESDAQNSIEYLNRLKERLSECRVIPWLEKSPVAALDDAMTYNNDFNTLNNNLSKWNINPAGSYAALESSIPWYSRIINISSARILHFHYQIDRAIAWNDRIQSKYAQK